MDHHSHDESDAWSIPVMTEVMHGASRSHYHIVHQIGLSVLIIVPFDQTNQITDQAATLDPDQRKQAVSLAEMWN